MDQNQKELQEAIAAADRVLELLREADEKLSSAKNWGVFDLLGGGLISSMVKRSRIDDAAVLLRRVGTAMEDLKKELSDVALPDSDALQGSSALQLVDVWLDNIIADWMVQSRIQNAQGQVKTLLKEVSRLRLKLIHAAEDLSA